MITGGLAEGTEILGRRQMQGVLSPGAHLVGGFDGVL